MPHIHTEPDQHDMTVSGYIVRKEGDAWKCLVHYHKKLDALMQIGGHIELNETPWQSMAHELAEETGYELKELDVLQFVDEPVKESGSITHPTPLTINTHNVGNDHYHSDLCFGFVAADVPQGRVVDGESLDLRWMTLDELEDGVKMGEVLQDVVYIYRYLLRHVDTLKLLPADSYSLEKPRNTGISYKRGAPVSNR